ncbi:MAG TPA: M28 family peptidase, partial [Gemmatimonadaceae bacterium]|nr:M28 family peptidase [Gemmatimonadaceae bacterium]
LIWLVAHLDSKSQTIPMLLRITSVIVAASLYAITVAALVWAVAFNSASGAPAVATRSAAATLAWITALLGVAATLPVLFCFIGNRSKGALDNASGVAAVILAIEMLRDGEVGVMITSGEELGLAGAKAYVDRAGMKGIALNCDTIDASGRFICMSSGPMPDRLSVAIDHAVRATGVEVRRQRMIPGVLADNIAFTEAGWPSFTLSRGNLGTLARVHTSRDRAGEIDGTGIAMAAQLLAATAKELS